MSLLFFSQIVDERNSPRQTGTDIWQGIRLQKAVEKHKGQIKDHIDKVWRASMCIYAQLHTCRC